MKIYILKSTHIDSVVPKLLTTDFNSLNYEKITDYQGMQNITAWRSNLTDTIPGTHGLNVFVDVVDTDQIPIDGAFDPEKNSITIFLKKSLTNKKVYTYREILGLLTHELKHYYDHKLDRNPDKRPNERNMWYAPWEPGKGKPYVMGKLGDLDNYYLHDLEFLPSAYTMAFLSSNIKTENLKKLLDFSLRKIDIEKGDLSHGLLFGFVSAFYGSKERWLVYIVTTLQNIRYYLRDAYDLKNKRGEIVKTSSLSEEEKQYRVKRVKSFHHVVLMAHRKIRRHLESSNASTKFMPNLD